MAKLSGSFQAVCIVAIILGALGLLTGLAGLVNLVGGQQYQEAVAAQTTAFVPASKAQRDAQRAMSAELEEATATWRGVVVAFLPVQFLVASGLVAGGVGSLRLAPTGRVVLMAALALGIVLEAGRIVPTLVIQWKTAEVTSRMMPEMMRASQPQGQPLPPQAQAQIEATTGAMMKAGIVFGFVLGALIALAKAGYYVLGLIHLRRPSVRALFEPPTTAELASGP